MVRGLRGSVSDWRVRGVFDVAGRLGLLSVFFALCGLSGGVVALLKFLIAG